MSSIGDEADEHDRDDSSSDDDDDDYMPPTTSRVSFAR
jgi:hypothetical protein